jgi:serine/threonine-protein kinase
MPLQPGTTLGVYEITAQIGAGGMGEVYRAHDTTLDRDVAIKVLPEAFATDPERLARFEREAKVLASLNHPNIAAIYGLEKSGEAPALVLELVEGPTLQDRIAQGAIPTDEALPIARQIAEALEAAHEQGIIHRDLKPANVKVKDDGTVKVLDFGLAKALEPEVSDTEAANSPTMTMTAAATRAGFILGTAAYMAPEQARGKQVDKRADVWAFGVVLYEMLTGAAPFSGDDMAQTLARVVEREPDWNALPATVSPSFSTYLRRCLEKNVRQRVQAIGDVRLAMEGAFETVGGEPQERAGTPIGALALSQRPAAIVALVLATAIVSGLVGWALTRPGPAEPAPVTRMAIVLPQTQVRTGTTFRGVAISPAGTHVAYVANRQLYLRALDQLDAQPLTGTEDTNATSPFFFADGQWIGFFAEADNTLKKVALSGGAAVTLAEMPSAPLGATWAADDTIVLASQGIGIFQVAGAGGTPDLLVSVGAPAQARQPQMLPGGETILYTLLGGGGGLGAWDTAQIVVERLATGERTVVVEGGSDARYLPTGHLVYALGSTLLAVPFDVDRLEVAGGAVPLVEGVSRVGLGAANADIAQTGVLVYLPGGAGAGGVAAARTLIWVDREGREDVINAPPHAYLYPRLSPDGTRLAVSAEDDERDLWVWEFARETLTRLTFTPEPEAYGLWTPDGARVIFDSGRDGGVLNLFWRAADGTGTVERLSQSPNVQVPQALSRDGARLVYREGVAQTADLYLLALDDQRRVDPLIATEFGEQNAEISPDGQWVAYDSNTSGQAEVYVQPFPNVDDGKWQISTTGGTRPLWGPDGRELFYVTEAGVMGISVETESAFARGPPAPVIEGQYYAGRVGRAYDIAPDGQRFLMIKEGVAAADDPFAGLTQIHVVLNWYQELLERVPVP